ncbi:hypothetical protein FMUND_5003 [Fusarium mundagurra]|uniref:Uncharacterized protein n=1 Tax=Fusarium mundagurra TaxID=1567541 RepID=A0A8H5YTV8_9HYPO|nr:hypothetical protein FMUND_5003 [Fusarium mundagurra]
MTDRVVFDNEQKQDASPPPGWPRSPKTLKESSLPTWQRVLVSSSLVLIPAPFLVLAVYMISLHQKPESQLGSRVLEAASIAATLWPIAFAAVLGTALRSVALYTCEKGTTLGTLEILMGSLTMTSTLKLLLWVRLVSFWSPLLILSWTLSPLGGQSVLRAVTINTEVIQHDFPIVSYPSTNWTAGFDWLPVLYAPPFGLRTVFGAAFSSPSTRLMHANGSSPNFDDTLQQVGGPSEARRISQQDTWGNARIPFLHMLEGYDLNNPHAWVDVPDNAVPPYESLIGVPIRGIPSTCEGNASLMIQSSYISLSCEPLVNGTPWIQENISHLVLAGREAALGNINVSFNNWSFFSASRHNEYSFRDEFSLPPIQFDLLEDQYLNSDGSTFNLTVGKDRPSKQTLVFVTDGSPIHNQSHSWNMTVLIHLTMASCLVLQTDSGIPKGIQSKQTPQYFPSSKIFPSSL